MFKEAWLVSQVFFCLNFKKYINISYMKNHDVELKVCLTCDAPLPFFPDKLSYFNISNTICDDCIRYKNKDI